MMPCHVSTYHLIFCLKSKICIAILPTTLLVIGYLYISYYILLLLFPTTLNYDNNIIIIGYLYIT